MSATKSGGLLTGSRAVILIFGLAIAFTVEFLMAAIAAFFPQYATVHYGANRALIGLIFAMFPIAVIVSSLVTGFLSQRCGRITICEIGLVLLGGGTFLFGYASSLPMFFLARILQGLGGGFTYTACFSLFSDHYAEELAAVSGLNELFVGLGYMAGAPAGAAVYTATSFQGVFFILGTAPAALAILLPICCWYFGVSSSSQPENSSSSSHQEGVSLRKLNGAYFSTALLLTFACFSFGFFEPMLALHLESVLHLDSTAIGGMFALCSVMYAGSGLAVGTVAESLGYRPLMYVGLFSVGLSLILLGPIPLLGGVDIQVMWVLQLVALTLMGLSFGTVAVPALPDMKKAVSHFGQASSDFVATSASVITFAGQAAGPILGGGLSHIVGFPWAATFMGSLLCATAVITAILSCCGCIPYPVLADQYTLVGDGPGTPKSEEELNGVLSHGEHQALDEEEGGVQSLLAAYS